jgi:hypothetical protein
MTSSQDFTFGANFTKTDASSGENWAANYNSEFVIGSAGDSDYSVSLRVMAPDMSQVGNLASGPFLNPQGIVNAANYAPFTSNVAPGEMIFLPGNYRFTPAAADAADGLVGVVLRGFTSLAPFGSCNVYPLINGDIGSGTDPTVPGALEAGTAVNLTGAGGTKQMAETQPGIYGAALGGGGALDFLGDGSTPDPPFLEPGSFTVDNGSGGADVGPFQATISVPPPLVWSNAQSLIGSNIDRSQSLTFQWAGGDPASEFAVLATIRIPCC